MRRARAFIDFLCDYRSHVEREGSAQIGRDRAAPPWMLGFGTFLG
jgi:hypothetical protein